MRVLELTPVNVINIAGREIIIQQDSNDIFYAINNVSPIFCFSSETEDDLLEKVKTALDKFDTEIK